LKGRPNVLGTFIALFALAFGIKGLQLVVGTDSYWVNPMFQGPTLIIAVALASQKGVARMKKRKVLMTFEQSGTGERLPSTDLTAEVVSPKYRGAPTDRVQECIRELHAIGISVGDPNRFEEGIDRIITASEMRRDSKIDELISQLPDDEIEKMKTLGLIDKDPLNEKAIVIIRRTLGPWLR
jgi:hypothetical protein